MSGFTSILTTAKRPLIECILVLGWAVFAVPLSAQAPIPEVPSRELRAVPAQPAGPEAVIQPRFDPGNTYRFVNRTEVRMELPGKGMREVTIEQQARFDVGVRTDGKSGVKLKGRTERLKILLKSGEKEISYDSLKPEDQKSALGQHFRSSLNRMVELTLNEELRIISSEESGRAGAATPLPGLPQFGPDELKQLINTVQQGFPEDPVRVGDEWVLKGSRPVGEVGELNFDLDYRYLGEMNYDSHNCSNIEFTGNLSGDVALSAGENSAFSRGRMDFQGTSIRGRILFDPLINMIRLNEQTIGMLLEVPGASGDAPVRVPMEQRASLSLLHVVPTKK